MVLGALVYILLLKKANKKFMIDFQPPYESLQCAPRATDACDLVSPLYGIE